MAKSTLPLPILFFFLLLLSLNSGKSLKLANAEENTWCVAKTSSSDAELTASINFCCDQLKDCSLIQKGGPCFFPDNLINHASVVMNRYYKMMGQNHWNCDFRGSGLIAVTDPSYGSCCYT